MRLKKESDGSGGNGLRFVGCYNLTGEAESDLSIYALSLTTQLK